MKVFYSGHAEWHISNSESLPVEAEVAGVFNLLVKNQKEMQYKNETNVQFLLPCYDHKDGVTLDGYTEADDIALRIGSYNEMIKFTSEDIVPEDTETETKKN